MLTTGSFIDVDTRFLMKLVNSRTLSSLSKQLDLPLSEIGYEDSKMGLSRNRRGGDRKYLKTPLDIMAGIESSMFGMHEESTKINFLPRITY
ncbi:hypothetical protein V6N13_112315 [Hibiscus sabdariffa]